MNTVYDLAIVGAGPAGIATSVEAVLLGIKKIILFEKGNNHSETIRKYFKDNKRVDKDWKGIKVELRGNIHFTDGTKESTLDLFDEVVKNKDIEACFNQEVFSIEKTNGSFKVETTNNKTVYAKNIVIAIGTMGKPNKPLYTLPSSLRKKINYNIADCIGNEKVLVVGGGDSATEFAYYIAKQNDVTLAYRKDNFSRVNPTNLHNFYDFVEKKLIKIKLGVDIDQVLDNNGKIEVYFHNKEIETYDRIIYALGGSNPIDFLQHCHIRLDENDKALIDENHNNYQEGIYLAGDIAGSVGGSIALALNHGYIIGTHIKQKYL